MTARVLRIGVAGLGRAFTLMLPTLRLDARVKFAERNRLSETPERAVQIVWAYGGNSQTFAQPWAPSSRCSSVGSIGTLTPGHQGGRRWWWTTRPGR